MKYLLDTNIISEPLRPTPSTRIMRRLREHEDDIAIPARDAVRLRALGPIATTRRDRAGATECSGQDPAIHRRADRRSRNLPPNNSSASADFLTHLEELAEDVVGDPHSRLVVTSEN